MFSFIEKAKLRNRVRRARARMSDSSFFEKELFLLDHLIQGGTALDIGANKGLYTLQLSRFADKVVSFEANPALVTKLRMAAPKNCDVIHAAVTDTSGTVTLNIPETDKGAQSPNTATLEAVHGKVATSINVPAIRLDDLHRDGTIKNVRFIKVDVEGHEEGVINGAKTLIDAERPTLMLEFNNPTDTPSKRLFSYFAEQYFAPMQLVGRTLTALPSHPQELHTRNVLFFPYETAGEHAI